MDKIRITGLQVHANHGVFPEERILGQKFIINAVLHLDLKTAAVSGDLEETVNYGQVCQVITDYTQENTFELIETLADNIGKELLERYPLLQAADIEVCKPWAPVGLPLENVSVEISRARHTVYIALGSNMGDREGYLWGAVDALGALDDFKVNKVSDFIETEAYGGIPQGDFINGILEGQTTMTPWELLEALHRIESDAGRTREVRWGPRTLDLDIIYYDDLVMETEKLTI
ncbi:MAG: dihydroneopterin aldolase, partial [Firmicutes bacterium]|nr:dihydroneopterin aldolase [Bacillota bacterium]